MYNYRSIVAGFFCYTAQARKASTGTIIGFQWNRAFAVSEKQNGPFKITGYYESLGMDKELYWFYYELSDNKWVSRKIESYIVVVRTNYFRERAYILKMDEWMDLQIGDTVLCNNSTITPVKAINMFIQKRDNSMKFYVFSGNDELLDSLRNRFPSGIEFSNDFNWLQALQTEQEWNHIIVIHDEKHPLGNIRPSADLPSWQHVEPGKYLGDVFIDWHDGALFAPAEVRQEIERMQAVENVCKQINEGSLSVRFDYSVFGGGRDADRCLLDIQKDGKAVGCISLGNDDTVSLWLDDGVRYMNEGMNERTNIIAFDEIESIVDFALKRDDTELVDALSLQGEVNLPYGAFYRDWSREDILNGVYANMMNGCMEPDTDDIDI